MRHIHNGYTLIELVLVIAIVSVLATLGFGSYSDYRAKGRDAVRVGDLGKIELAIDMYYETCREYPAALAVTANNGCPSGTTLGSYIPSLPTDPLGASYTYSTSGAGNGHDAYVTRVELELQHVVLIDDIDGATHDGVSLDCADTTDLYYCIGS
jgi:prepilin-type N-terminal cleavage/methylation domain-containing protein